MERLGGERGGERHVAQRRIAELHADVVPALELGHDIGQRRVAEDELAAHPGAVGRGINGAHTRRAVRRGETAEVAARQHDARRMGRPRRAERDRAVGDHHLSAVTLGIRRHDESGADVFGDGVRGMDEEGSRRVVRDVEIGGPLEVKLTRATGLEHRGEAQAARHAQHHPAPVAELELGTLPLGRRDLAHADDGSGRDGVEARAEQERAAAECQDERGRRGEQRPPAAALRECPGEDARRLPAAHINTHRRTVPRRHVGRRTGGRRGGRLHPRGDLPPRGRSLVHLRRRRTVLEQLPHSGEIAAPLGRFGRPRLYPPPFRRVALAGDVAA